jgi:hypothetical protein
VLLRLAMPGLWAGLPQTSQEFAAMRDLDELVEGLIYKALVRGDEVILVPPGEEIPESRQHTLTVVCIQSPEPPPGDA